MALPTSLPGLVFWYEGSAVALNGSNVAVMYDQSGTNDPNKNAMQQVVAQQPTYTAIDPNFNNNPTVQFAAGVNQSLQTGAFVVPVAQPTTRFFAISATDTGGGYVIDSLNGGAQYSLNASAGSLVLGNGGSLQLAAGAIGTSPMIVVVTDNGASSTVAFNNVAAGTTGNGGANGATGLTIGNFAGLGSAFTLGGSIAEIFGFSRILTATEIAAMCGYLQQKYGIAVKGATQPAAVSGPFLSDLILASQQRADRVNASTITTAEWTQMVNASVQELYGALTSTYEDYNVKSAAFSLAGGSTANNTLAIGPNTTVPDFFQPRALWLLINGSPTPYITIPRLESFQERNRFTFPAIVPIYGAVPSRWNIMGSNIEILPPQATGNSYLLWYVPTMPTLVNQSDSIAAQWLSVNGWHEYVVLDVAAKALIKEESLDTASLLLQQKAEMRTRIMLEAKPRDISQPKSIVDMARLRNPWGSWGAGGLPGLSGGGWGDGGNGMW